MNILNVGKGMNLFDLQCRDHVFDITQGYARFPRSPWALMCVAIATGEFEMADLRENSS